MAKARKRRQRQRGGDSSFSCSSSSDGMSAEEAPLTGSSDIRAIIIAAMRETQVKQTKEIKQMLEEHKEELKDIKEQLKKLNEDNISLYTQLERLNCSSCDGSPPSRPEPNQMKPPRFRLKISSVVNETVDTRKNIQTSAGNYIEVSLYEGGNPIAPNHPLASAEVMMVVLNGEFNKDNNQYNWSKEDFEKSIVRPRRGNSATGDENHGIKSIVSNCTFYLTGGSHRHSNATIVNNSGNKNVRLGVMVLSPSEERVLEGLSNHFLVRDSSKKSNKQRKALGNGQEQNGPSSPTIGIQKAGNGIDIVPEQVPPTANMDNQLGEDIRHSVQTIDNEAAEVAEDMAYSYFKYGVEEFSAVRLAMATNNFALDRVIGEGSFGTVYKGRLPDGRQVAIKRWQRHQSPRSPEEFEKEFQNELTIGSSLHHKHIAPLLGWSVQEEERFLVYEYMENGSLHDQLHHQPPSLSSLVTTPWRTRIEILLGVSRAIEYMHCHAVPRVIHRDINSSNILLDASWVPHISDFGISVTFDKANKDEQMNLCGTYGYLDLEYWHTGLLKPTSDLYNFGMVILEVLTGKSPYILREEVVCDISTMQLIEAGKLEDVLDKRPEVPNPTPRQLEALELVAHTAVKCLQKQGEDRPAISDVVADLEKAAELVRRARWLARSVRYECDPFTDTTTEWLIPDPSSLAAGSPRCLEQNTDHQ